MSEKKRPIVVLADDISGAAELANAARGAGLSAEVQMRFCAVSRADAIFLNTATRSLPADLAAAQVEEAARAIAVLDPELIYKKCDSVLRGNVAAECLGIARGLGRSRVLLMPANPSRNRIIRGGNYFVDGIPLDQTAFAADPEHPCYSSRVGDLLGPASGIETPDVESAADLIRQAVTVDERTLAAGGVDFFEALLELGRRGVGGRVREELRIGLRGGGTAEGAALWVCGSHAAWMGGRGAECVRRGIPPFPMPPELFAGNSPVEILKRWAGEAAAALRKRGAALLAIGEGRPDRGVTPARLEGPLAECAEIVLGMTGAARVYLEGGATASAVITRLGHERFDILASPGPGVGALRPVEKIGPVFLIKPGSYPWPDFI